MDPREFLQKIESPEQFSKIMTHTAKNAELNLDLKGLCGKIFSAHKVYESLEIILGNFFGGDFQCLERSALENFVSVAFEVDGVKFEIRSFKENLMESVRGAVNDVNRIRFNRIHLLADGEKKLSLRWITAQRVRLLGSLNEVESPMAKIGPFDPERDEAYLKPENWLTALKTFHTSWKRQMQNDAPEIPKKFEIEIDPALVKEFGSTDQWIRRGILSRLDQNPKEGLPSTHHEKLQRLKMVSNIQTISSQNLTYGRLLGEGSFGKVYEGTWQQSAVAIKQFINQQLTEQAQGEIENEKTVMASMSHPHIIRFYGVCPSPLSLVMELMPQSLYQLLHSRQDLPWKVRYQISGDIANGLWYLHEEKNIVHRDLKSLNVLLDDKLRAKITDFGLAKVKADSKTMSTKSQGVGSILWMAPEQFGIRPKHSKASDIYSYAIVLLEIASRRNPYEGAELSEVKDCVKSGEREERPENCPQRFWQLITDCWEQEAEQRPRIVKVQARCVELLQQEEINLEEVTKTRYQAPPAPLKQSPQRPMETQAMQEQFEEVKIDARITAPQSALPAMAFGKAEWAKYFGDIGDEPPLPANIEQILNSQCIFWPGQQVKDTHLLVLVPNTVNGKPFNLNLLSEIIQSPKAGNKTQYQYYSDRVKNELGNKSFPSHWVLMTHDVIPNSLGQNYENQKSLVQKHAQQSGIPYELPRALEATTAILMEHVKTGKRLYSDEPYTWTCCIEKVNNNQWPAAIGGFSSGGLDVVSAAPAGTAPTAALGVAGSSRLLGFGPQAIGRSPLEFVYWAPEGGLGVSWWGRSKLL